MHRTTSLVKVLALPVIAIFAALVPAGIGQVSAAGAVSLGGPISVNVYSQVPGYVDGNYAAFVTPSGAPVNRLSVNTIDFNPFEYGDTPPACNSAPNNGNIEDYQPNANGTCTVTDTGRATFMEMTLSGTLTVPAAGTYNLTVSSDDGFQLGFATVAQGGAGTVSSTYGCYNCTGTTYQNNYPTVAGYNACCVGDDVMTLTFSSAGIYPFEIDYAQGLGPGSIFLGTASGAPLVFSPPATTACYGTICPNALAKFNIGGVSGTFKLAEGRGGAITAGLLYSDTMNPSANVPGCYNNNPSCQLTITSFSCTTNSADVYGTWTYRGMTHTFHIYMTGTARTMGTFSLSESTATGTYTRTVTGMGIVYVNCPPPSMTMPQPC